MTPSPLLTPVRLGAALVLGLVCSTLGGLAAGSAAASTPWPGHPGRHLVGHTVRPGDTATGLAVRYHAWTRELISLNHLGPAAVLRTGQHIRIPVVDAAASRHRPHTKQHAKHHARQGHHHRHRGHRGHRAKQRAHPWRHSHMRRERVRKVIERRAGRNRVPAKLALAIAWQESGWQQHVISSANAVGVMQLLPATGRWMSLYAGKRLNVYGTRDNVRGGVLLLRYLLDHTRHDRRAIGAYYQGLGAVRSHGLYPETRHYVRSVKAIRKNLRRTGHPSR